MSDDPARVESPEAIPSVTNSRILAIMAAVGVVGSLVCSFYISPRFGIGVFLGTAAAFANYLWLSHSLNRLFTAAAEGEKPKLSPLRFVGRYFAIGILIVVVFLTKIVPITAFLLGLAAIAFAVMIEGFIRIFTTIFKTKET
jgi:hypothetical protein